MSDQEMDDLLREVLSAAAPEPSRQFQSQVMQRVARRVMPSWARGVLVAYTIASVVLCVWLLREFPIPVVLAALATSAALALATGAYATRLLRSHT